MIITENRFFVLIQKLLTLLLKDVYNLLHPFLQPKKVTATRIFIASLYWSNCTELNILISKIVYLKCTDLLLNGFHYGFKQCIVLAHKKLKQTHKTTENVFSLLLTLSLFRYICVTRKKRFRSSLTNLDEWYK